MAGRRKEGDKERKREKERARVMERKRVGCVIFIMIRIY